MTPQQARAKFGPPSHVVQGPLETAYNYDADHRRVVIVETRSHSSGDGTQLTDVELRAVVDAAFTRALKQRRCMGTGKFLEIWQRQQGKWRIIRDIWRWVDGHRRRVAAGDRPCHRLGRTRL